MGAINTTYTFTATDTITSTKMNNIIDQTTFTDDAVFDTTLFVASGKLKVNAQGITSNELAANAVKTIAIEDGAVTSAKLNSSVILVPAGAVMAFAMDSPPNGWLRADGATVSRTTYAALFAAIGGTWGVDSVNFVLPDLRGIFVRGKDNGRGQDPDRNFGSFQSDGVGPLSLSGVTGADYFSSTNTGSTGGGASKINMFNFGSGTETKPIYVAASNTIGETRPKNIALLYCIKY